MIKGIVLSASALHDLTKLYCEDKLYDKTKGYLNRNKYPVLNTDIDKIDVWWDSLSWDDKVDVGGVAIHLDEMTANYIWLFDNYADLKKSQKRILELVFECRDKKFEVLPILGLFKLTRGRNG